MRKFLLLLVLFTSFLSFSQKKEGLLHDSRLLEYVLDFREHVNKYDIDLTELDKVVVIKFIPHEELIAKTQRPAWATTIHYKSIEKYIVYLSYDILQFKKPIIEALFYHELYHVLATNKEHCMGDEGCSKLIDGTPVNPYWVMVNWGEEEKDIFFKYLEYNQKKYK